MTANIHSSNKQSLDNTHTPRSNETVQNVAQKVKTTTTRYSTIFREEKGLDK
jgi:hypothetical protein